VENLVRRRRAPAARSRANGDQNYFKNCVSNRAPQRVSRASQARWLFHIRLEFRTRELRFHWVRMSTVGTTFRLLFSTTVLFLNEWNKRKKAADESGADS